MRRGRPPYPDLLTPREQEVMQLLRQGLTNQQIADRLGITLYGARYHVSEILSKLGVSNREEAAAWQGERVWGLGLPAVLLSKAGNLRWEPLMKATSIALLGGAAGIGLLLTLGAIIVLTSGGDSDPATEQAASEPTSEAGLAPDATPPGPPPYREYGPYRIGPHDYVGDTSTVPSPLALAPAEQGEAVSDAEAARASSLFPATIPEGYRVIEADSDGQPSELFLRLVLEGPGGRVEVERSRPLVMPLDHRYDPATHEARPALLPRGFALIPAGGDDETPGGYLRGMEGGIDTAVFGAGVTVDEARSVYRTMTGSLGPSTAERLLPALDRTPDSLPRPEDIIATGPCSLDVVVTPNYLAPRQGEIEIASRVACTGLVPLTTCDPGYVYTVPGLEVACDGDGYRIDATWRLSSPNASCRGGGPVYVEAGTLHSAHVCSSSVGGSGSVVTIESCVSIRDQETCARFEYEVP